MDMSLDTHSVILTLQKTTGILIQQKSEFYTASTSNNSSFIKSLSGLTQQILTLKFVGVEISKICKWDVQMHTMCANLIMYLPTRCVYTI